MTGPGTWLPSALRPSAAWLDLGRWALVAGFCAVFAVLIGRASARRVEKWAVWATIGHATVAIAHGLLDARQVFAVLQPRWEPERLLGPLVNPNHAASLAAAGSVLCLHRVWNARRTEQRWFAGVGAFLGLTVIALASSTGAAAAFLVGCAVLIAWRWIGTPRRLFTLATTGALAYLVYVALGTPGMRSDRASIYAGTLRCLDDFWAVGSGAGSFELVFPYCSGDTEYRLVSHAHADGLQWVLEHGAVGAALLVLATLVVSRGAHDRSGPWFAALATVLAHALVDFPLQIPLVLIVAALLAVSAVHRPSDGSRLRHVWLARGSLAILGVAQLVGAGGLWVSASADAQTHRDVASEASSLPWISTITPWRWEWSLVSARQVEGGEVLRERLAQEVWHDANALRILGKEQWVRDGAAHARPTLQRAATLAPNDLRVWVLLAGLEQREGDVVATADAWGHALCLEGGHSRWKLLLRAYRTIPEGLVWVDRLSQCDAQILDMLGKRIGDQDPEVSLLAFQLAARERGFSADVARLLVTTGRTRDALAYVQAARNAHPDDPRLMGHEGRVQVALTAPDAALPLLQQAVTRYPDFRPDLVRALTLLDPDEALRTVHRFQLLGDHSPELGLAEAEAALVAGRFEVCATALTESGALRHGSTSTRARQVRDACVR